jgi:1-acyl-sn-glycerol-3-phosphate acyltransferase
MRSVMSVYSWMVWLLHFMIPGPFIVLAVLVSPRRLGFWLTLNAIRSALFLTGIKVVVQGQERVDWSRAHVFMGNHQNMIDPFAMIVALERHIVVIEKVENLKIPVYGWLTRAWGNIAIRREDQGSGREGIALAAQRLKEGVSIGIMPEGTRTKDGTIGAFKKGGFHMAIDAGADIVPFTINGGFDRLPRGDWRIYPGTIEIVFGKTISTEGVGKQDLDGLIERVRGEVLANFKGPRALEAAGELVS